MRRIIVFSSLFVVLIPVMELFTYYISLFLIVFLPIVISGNSCGINPNTQFCVFISGSNYHAIFDSFSWATASAFAFLLAYWLYKKKKLKRS